MKTRITQEEAYEFLKLLPKEISKDKYKDYEQKSLHLRMTNGGLKCLFTEKDLKDTYRIKNLRLSHFYKGRAPYKRVPLQVGSMALWTTVFQYMDQIKKENELPIKIDSSLRYIGTEDEAIGVSSIQSSQELPYRLVHSFLDSKDNEVLFIEDVYREQNKKESSLYLGGKFYGLNYLEEDKLRRKVNIMGSVESELSKIIKKELDFYKKEN